MRISVGVVFRISGMPFFFYVIGNFVLLHKKLRGNRTAAELNNVANATRRRRRILQAGFFFMRWTRKNRQKKKLKISWIEFEIVGNDGLRKNTKIIL